MQPEGVVAATTMTRQALNMPSGGCFHSLEWTLIVQLSNQCQYVPVISLQTSLEVSIHRPRVHNIIRAFDEAARRGAGFVYNGLNLSHQS